jgi:hypothetical protein
MCVQGDACSTVAPGHGLHLIQARLASATPADWVDAIVESVSPRDGVVVLRTIDHASRIEVWSGAGAAGAASPGAPVALHRRYHVLAVGAQRFNVLTD